MLSINYIFVILILNNDDFYNGNTVIFYHITVKKKKNYVFIYIIVSESIYSLFIKKNSSDFGVKMFLAGFVRSVLNSTWNTFRSV